MKRPVYFVQIKKTHDDTWLDSKWMNKIVPVQIDYTWEDGTVTFRPFTNGCALAPFFIPFNAIISTENCIPSTEEAAINAWKKLTGENAVHIEEYDSRDLRKLFPKNKWMDN